MLEAKNRNVFVGARLLTLLQRAMCVVTVQYGRRRRGPLYQLPPLHPGPPAGLFPSRRGVNDRTVTCERRRRRRRRRQRFDVD